MTEQLSLSLIKAACQWSGVHRLLSPFLLPLSLYTWLSGLKHLIIQEIYNLIGCSARNGARQCWAAQQGTGCAPSPRVYCLICLLFSRSVMSDTLHPHELYHTRLPCLLPSPGVCSDSYPLSRWCHPTISSSVCSVLLLLASLLRLLLRSFSWMPSR